SPWAPRFPAYAISYVVARFLLPEQKAFFPPLGLSSSSYESSSSSSSSSSSDEGVGEGEGVGVGVGVGVDSAGGSNLMNLLERASTARWRFACRLAMEGCAATPPRAVARRSAADEM